MNGRSSGSVWFSTLTCSSLIASSSADCVRGVVRLISSARTMFAKTGPGLNSNCLGLRVEDRDAQHVAGQQVGRELDAAELAVDAAGQRPGQDGLADAGHVFDQHVPAGEQPDQQQIDRTACARGKRSGCCLGADQLADSPRLTRKRSTDRVTGAFYSRSTMKYIRRWGVSCEQKTVIVRAEETEEEFLVVGVIGIGRIGPFEEFRGHVTVGPARCSPGGDGGSGSTASSVPRWCRRREAAARRTNIRSSLRVHPPSRRRRKRSSRCSGESCSAWRAIHILAIPCGRALGSLAAVRACCCRCKCCCSHSRRSRLRIRICSARMPGSA